jgi:TPR repeat protein
VRNRFGRSVLAAALAAGLAATQAVAQSDDPIGDLLEGNGPVPAEPAIPTEKPLPAPTDTAVEPEGSGAPAMPSPAGPIAEEPPANGDSITVDAEPDSTASPFELPLALPPPEIDLYDAVPVSESVDYAYGAFQRGLYLTAFAIALRRAEQGEATAQTLVGYLFANGLGVPRNFEEAATWYRLAADGGDAGAMVELANLHAIGMGVERDPAKARSLLETALAGGRPEAAYGLGLIYLDPQNPGADKAKAADLFRTAADAGSIDAQYALATMLMEGAGVAPDLREAARRMGLAARGGHIGAQVEYGIMLFNGKGLDKNETAAATWFEVAARAGNPVAENRLARLYATGRGVPLDLKRAATWHFKARRGGVSDLWLDGLVETLPATDQNAASQAAEDLAGE